MSHNHWSQMTIKNKTKSFEILWEFPKCERHTKQADGVGKLALTDWFHTGLPQTFSIKKCSVCEVPKEEVCLDLPCRAVRCLLSSTKVGSFLLLLLLTYFMPYTWESLWTSRLIHIAIASVCLLFPTFSHCLLAGFWLLPQSFQRGSFPQRIKFILLLGL